MKLKILPLFIILLAGCAKAVPPANLIINANSTMQITSPSFANMQTILKIYTCDGDNISPPLEISGVPANAKSLVLIMDDPDAPGGLWVHWLVWNIPPETNVIPENVKNLGVTGANTRGNNAYGSPCPPDRQHRYFFKLYALDTTLDLMPQTKKDQLEQAMAGHIIDQAQLIGLYNRK